MEKKKYRQCPYCNRNILSYLKGCPYCGKEIKEIVKKWKETNINYKRFFKKLSKIKKRIN
ncbi:hypothetical protein ES695_10465 [Candidatus Atribacteria bacterium 1244-E10-H5-B2]|nr:MAG: hypothetical protein ES695_10465 [Candidatus Atribacteria bacterium 1244-E10-H5-B2]